MIQLDVVHGILIGALLTLAVQALLRRRSDTSTSFGYSPTFPKLNPYSEIIARRAENFERRRMPKPSIFSGLNESFMDSMVTPPPPPQPNEDSIPQENNVIEVDFSSPRPKNRKFK